METSSKDHIDILSEKKKFFLWSKVPKIDEENSQIKKKEENIKKNDKTAVNVLNNEKNVVPPIPRTLWTNHSSKLTKKDDSEKEKVTKKALNSPLVPLGMAATVGCFIGMCVSTYKKDRLKAQLFMRGRIAAQFFTICTLVGGAWYFARKNVNNKKKDVEENLNSLL